MQRGEVAAGQEQEAWHSITNPIAQQVVQEVFQHLPEGALQLHSWSKYPASGFQQRVRDELERSGLAQKIAAGTAELPLIFDYMPRELKPLDWHSQIATPGALAVHVMRHLEWYLKPAGPIHMLWGSAWLKRHRISLQFLAYALFSLAVGIWSKTSTNFLSSIGLAGTAFLLYGTVLFFLIAFTSWLVEQDKSAAQEDIRCAEFFRYLVDTYADEEEGANTNPQSGRAL
jgi:hypothetical protein